MSSKRGVLACACAALIVAVWAVTRVGLVFVAGSLLAGLAVGVGIPVMRLRKRDRAELFRSLRGLGRVGLQWSLSWTFTRPRNFLVTFVAGVTVLVVGLSFMHSTPRQHTAAAPLVVLPTGEAPTEPVTIAASPVAAPPTSAVPYLPPATHAAPTVPPTSPAPSVTPPKDAMPVAARFLGAWSRHPAGITLAAWRASMRPYITPRMDAGFATSDPQNVPSTDCGDPRMGVTADGQIQILAACPPAGNVTLILIRAGTGWAVDDIT